MIVDVQSGSASASSLHAEGRSSTPAQIANAMGDSKEWARAQANRLEEQGAEELQLRKLWWKAEEDKKKAEWEKFKAEGDWQWSSWPWGNDKWSTGWSWSSDKWSKGKPTASKAGPSSSSSSWTPQESA